MNTHKMEQMILEGLKKSGDMHRVSIVEVMPEISTMLLRCKEHGPFMLSVRSFLGPPDGSKLGRRCPICEEREPSRPSFAEVVERAAKLGYAPEFREEDFMDTQGLLEWRCIKHPEEKRVCHLYLMHTRKCPECVKEGRQKRLLARLKQWARRVGDRILSSEEQCTSKEALIEYRCGNCGKVLTKSAAALLQSEGHDCRARKRRNLAMQAKHAALAKEARRAGITIVTPAHLYTGSKCHVRIKDGVSTRSRRVSHQTLNRLINERFAERGIERRKRRALMSANKTPAHQVRGSQRGSATAA